MVVIILCALLYNFVFLVFPPTKYHMWLLQIFVKMLCTGGNIFYWVFFINVHNLLSVIQCLGYFQILVFQIMLWLTTFWIKFLCISNYSFRIVFQCHIVKSFSILLFFPVSCLKKEGSEAKNKANKHANKNHEINKTSKHPHPMIIDKSGILFYLLIICSLKTLIMFSLYDCWTSVFLVWEVAF